MVFSKTAEMLKKFTCLKLKSEDPNLFLTKVRILDRAHGALSQFYASINLF